MDQQLNLTPASAVRGLIARTYLGVNFTSHQLGVIRLRDHQQDAIRRLKELLVRFGGALLADEVGLGKTYSALGVADEYSRPLVVAPASLIPMWKRSTLAAQVRNAAFVSHEALSRRRLVTSAHDLLIVDEAHHARNPATQRYAELARLAIDRRVLLISATPIHNNTRDLRALFALFMGSRAWTCPECDLTRAVVRREQRILAADLPVSKPAVAIQLSHNDALLEQIAAVPPPVPARDAGDGGALVIHGLVRQWSSSDAALIKALLRRKSRAMALIAALEEGRHPTLAELRSWTQSDDAIQLGFPSMLAQPSAEASPLLDAVRLHERAVSGLLRQVKAAEGADRERAAQLMALRVTHHGARIVAFTQFTETAHAMYAALAPAGGAAMLTARGATVVGGRLARPEALARFNDPDTRPADRIDFLVATDLLSEGIDLPEVSVVVHLDLPWTPARLEQRVGRAVRLGSRQREVAVYHMVPPASANALLRVEELLRRKLGDAARTIGVAGAILPSLDSATLDASPPSVAQEQLRAVLKGWVGSSAIDVNLDEPTFACVSGARSRWIALLCDTEDRAILIAGGDGRVSRDAPSVADALGACGGPDLAVEPTAIQRALRDITAWLESRSAERVAGLDISPAARSGARLLRRIGSIANRAPFHRRRAITSLASHARGAVLSPRGIGAERVLAELAESTLDDEAWLRAVGAFTAANSQPRHGDRSSSTRLVALIVAVPD